MIFSKKTETDHPPLADAIEQYKQAAGGLFKKPKRSLCKFEKNAWLLFDRENTLICIVSESHGAVFADNLACCMRQVALSHVKK